MITFSIFIISIVVDIVLIFGLIFSIIKPKYRIWPPPERFSWQFWISWILTIISFIGVIILSVLDWNKFIFNNWLRLPIGVGIIALGLTLAIWGVRTLSIHSTLGLKGKLITKGPYKYTRNPQYVADILIFISLIIISNSFLTLITGILGILWNLLTPYAEEPWLKEQFKEEYDVYRKKVRRFI